MRYLRHVSTGRTYPYTDALANRGDMQLVAETKPSVAASAERPRGEGDGPPKSQENPEPTSSQAEGGSGDDAAPTGDDGTSTQGGDDAPPAKPVSRMNKDELEAFARDRYGVELDKRHNLTDLKQQVRELGKA